MDAQSPVMSHLLRSKNLATKFQILVEIAANQPTVHQKSIAAKLNVTPQAISEYMAKLEQEGWVVSDGRSRYRVTQEGINWMLSMLGELRAYFEYVQNAVTNITVCAAVADTDLVQGQPVGLQMKGGLLYATAELGNGASGTAFSGAKKGEDVGVSNIKGIVAFEKGRITVLKAPDIQSGGSKAVDKARLKEEADKGNPVGAIGIEAFAALRRIGVSPQYSCGVTEAAIEAARIGLSFVVVCSADAVPQFIGRLNEAKIDYTFLDLDERASA